MQPFGCKRASLGGCMYQDGREGPRLTLEWDNSGVRTGLLEQGVLQSEREWREMALVCQC